MITPAYSPTATERVLPRMALDFTTGVLDPRVTVTRALDTATRVNSSGYIETVNANLPRFDYNPTTLALKGLLIEEARTNIVLQSSDSSQSPWTPASGGVGTLAVVTPNAGVSPDGTSNAVRVQFDCTDTSSSSNRSRIEQSLTVVSGATYAKAVWIKAYDVSNVGKTVRVLVEGIANTVVYTLTDQWVRVTPPAGAASSTAVKFMIETRGTFTTQTADILMWNATVEAGAFLTSDIITGATSLTRNADVVSMTGTNFSDWYNASEGTFVCATTGGNVSTGQWAVPFDVVGSGNELYVRQTSATAVSSVINGTGSSAFTITSGASYTSAIAYKLNNCAFSVNAATVSATAAVPTTPTSLVLGSLNGTFFLNKHISKFSFYPQRLTNAEVQAFSK